MCIEYSLMKISHVSGFLLLVIVSYLAIPIVPIIEFMVYNDYIAKNLCENRDKPKSCCKGKCYLVKQLKKANQNTENTPKDTKNKTQLKELKEYILSLRKSFTKSPSEFKYFERKNICTNQILIFHIFTPPEVSTNTRFSI